jgi:hypothetical protein
MRLLDDDAKAIPAAVASTPRCRCHVLLLFSAGFVLLLLVVVVSNNNNNNLQVAANKPPISDKVASARWLMATTDYGVLATTTTTTSSIPFANVISFADGTALRDCTGVPYFYLTKLDATARHVSVNPKASFAVTAKSGNYKECLFLDAQSPLCARITLTGSVVRVSNSSSPEYAHARKALFARHPVMKDWPQEHGFEIYTMKHIDDIFFLNEFGGAHPISVEDYLKYKA